MASTRHVKLNSSWEKLEISPDLLSNKEFESLISCKVLTDYEILDSSASKSKTSFLNVKKNKTKKPEISKVKSKLKGNPKKNKNAISSGNSAIDISAELLEENTKSECKKETPKSKQNKNKVQKKKDGWTVTPLQKEKTTAAHNDSTIKQKKVKQRQNEGEKYSKETKKNIDKNAKKRKQNIVESYSSERKRIRKEESETNTSHSLDDGTINEKMAAWKNLFVPKEVLQALCDNKFLSPTPIQAMALPSAIRDRKDIVGAAETGSGKTLAFGIPVIHNILNYKERQARNGAFLEEEGDEKTEERGENDPKGGEENSFDDEDDDDDDDDDNDDDDLEEEQKEIEFINMDENLQSDEDSELEDKKKMKELGCVKVIDDADFSSLGFPDPGPVLKTSNKAPLALILQPTRELAVQVKDHLQVAAAHTDIAIAPILGGMSVEKQKRILKKCPDILVATPGRLWELVSQDPYLSRIDEVDSLVIDEADRMIEKGHFEELTQILAYINRNEKKKNKRQTFVFSATLTLVHSGPQRSIRKKTTLTEEKKLETLMSRIQMREKPKVIDLTRKIGTVETLTEARINCSLEEKDLYLYYFLTQYPGRTLIFANSKDCIRRLVSIFTLLKTNPLPLHADMHQKQRLKNLEKFTSNDNAVLLASDVAARGLDIPNVEHVIHYQVPQTVENYVHRSGRTARAMKEGLSVMLISPEDVRNYRKIIHTLNRDEDLPIFPVEHQLVSVLRKRLNLAKKIDTEEHRFNKKKRQNEWFEKAAKEMDMLIDDEDLISDLGDSFELSGRKQDLKHMKSELDQMLTQRLAAHSFSGKYLTQAGKLELPADEDKKDALKVVKKDRKLQDTLLASSHQSKKTQNMKKKSKWKKKK